jgi:hypothetical protein
MASEQAFYGTVFRAAEGSAAAGSLTKPHLAIKLTPAMLTVPSQQCGMSEKTGLKSPR